MVMPLNLSMNYLWELNDQFYEIEGVRPKEFRCQAFHCKVQVARFFCMDNHRWRSSLRFVMSRIIRIFSRGLSELEKENDLGFINGKLSYIVFQAFPCIHIS